MSLLPSLIETGLFVEGGEVFPALWVEDSRVCVQSIYGLHVFIAQLDVLSVKIFLHSLIVGWFWDHHDSSLHVPSEADLGWRMPKSLSNFLDRLVIKKGSVSWESCWAHWCVSNYWDLHRFMKCQEFFLWVEWVHLNLVVCWSDSAVRQQVVHSQTVLLETPICFVRPSSTKPSNTFHISSRLGDKGSGGSCV